MEGCAGFEPDAYLWGTRAAQAPPPPFTFTFPGIFMSRSSHRSDKFRNGHKSGKRGTKATARVPSPPNPAPAATMTTKWLPSPLRKPTRQTHQRDAIDYYSARQQRPHG